MLQGPLRRYLQSFSDCLGTTAADVGAGLTTPCKAMFSGLETAAFNALGVSPYTWTPAAATRLANTGSSSWNTGVSSNGSKRFSSSAGSSSSSSSNASDSSMQQLRDLLELEKVSYPALMSMLQYHLKHPVKPDKVASNIAALKQRFGPDLVNRMLETSPAVATRAVDTLQLHYEGLRTVLGEDDALAKAIVARAADVLNRSPATLAQRLNQLQDTFQVGHAEILQLVGKAPALLWSSPAHLAAVTGYLQEVSGLSMQQLFRTFITWPNMATFSKVKLMDTHKRVQALLQATPADMHRVCKTHPGTLCRDPLQLLALIQNLQVHLQKPHDEVAALIRQQPGLLSWNLSELINRIIVVSQALRLEPVLRGELLSAHNRALLTSHTDIPQRVEYLIKYLGLSESELLPLLHNSLSVLRLTTELMDSKAACCSSLALLNPAWGADLQAMGPQQKLRLLLLSPARFWRMVYLVHTGQQDCGTFQHNLHMSAADFDKMQPGYKGWLDRYNTSVSSKGIPLVPTLISRRLGSPETYTPIHSDGFSGRTRSNASSCSSLEATPNTLHNSRFQSTQAPHFCNAHGLNSSGAITGTRVFADVPTSPAAAIAAWWGVEVRQAEGMLAQLQGLKQRFGRQQWQERLVALHQLMTVLGWVPVNPQSSSNFSLSRDSTSGDDGAGSIDSKDHDDGSRSSSAESQSIGSSADKLSAAEGNRLLPVAAESGMSSYAGLGQPATGQQRRRRRRALRQEHSHQQEQDGQSEQGQQQRSTQRHPHNLLDSFNMPPEAHQALQHAMASGHPAAVAAVSVACRLTPFSQQLDHLPPMPPDAVVQFALQYPKVIGRLAFVANCHVLSALASESEYLRTQLQQATMKVLSKCLDKHPVRLKMMQFLVQTQQPMPWAFTFKQLLVHEVLGPQGTGGSRVTFVAAYPAFEDWAQVTDSI